MIWLKFIGIQLVMLLATIVGWVLLLPFCVFKRWTTTQWLDGFFIYSTSLKDKRTIDHWNSILMNAVYGNPEDGVSGQYALIWNAGGTALGPYAPTRWVWLNAYLWSAWRNSCDNLKYVFHDPDGPLVTFKLFGRTMKFGWQPENGFNVPVASL